MIKNGFVFTPSLKVSILSLLGVLILVSCGGKGLQRLSEPDWIHRGNGAFMDRKQQAFYGVGSIYGVKNKPEARTTAGDRARAEISKLFETYTTLLMQDYSAPAIARSIGTSTGAQNMEPPLTSFSEKILKGVVMMDHWSDSSDDRYYTLARLDLERFTEQINKA